MGDYTKIIVNCDVKIKEEDIPSFKEELLENVEYMSSSYHCGGELLEIRNSFGQTSLSFITQLKYSRGLEEFITWLRPFVIQGFGPNDIFCLAYTEYSIIPTEYKLRNYTERDLL